MVRQEETMTRARWLPAVLAAVLGIGALVAGSQQPAAAQEAEEPNLKVLQYNTTGVVRNQGRPPSPNVDPDDFRFLDVLAGRLAEERPHLVTINEICRSQIVYLEDRLRGRYPMTATYFHDSNDDLSRCPTEDQSAGTAILTVGPAEAITAPGGLDVGCVQWHHQAVFPVRSCVVHFGFQEVPGNVGAAFSPWVDVSPVIIAGDFNTEPPDPALDQMYSADVVGGTQGRFYEADMCGIQCGQPPFRGGDPTREDRKIDYIFMDDQHFGIQPNGFTEDTAGQCGGLDCSDHRMLWGELALTDAVTDLPTGIPDQLAMHQGANEQHADWTGAQTDNSIGRPWRLDPCTVVAHPSDAHRVDFRTVEHSEPGFFGMRQLALYPNVVTAQDALADFTAALGECGEGESTTFVFENLDPPPGSTDEGITATSFTGDPDFPIGEVSRYVVLRLDNAVVLAMTAWEGSSDISPDNPDLTNVSAFILQQLCTLGWECE
jgi:hypothetical protein